MRYFVLFFTLLIFTNIYPQKKRENKMNNKTRIEQSLITSDFEKFDSLMFNKLKNKEKDIIVYGKLDDGRNIVFRDLTNGKDYSEAIINSYFYIGKSYYPNNNIAAKGLGFIYHGFKVGTWYYFDENGNLTQTEDHDKPFKFTLEDIFKFLEKEKIPIKKEWDNEKDGFYRTGINRIYDPQKGECYWVIDWFKYDINKVVEIYLDGTTGKEIKREYMDYIV